MYELNSDCSEYSWSIQFLVSNVMLLYFFVILTAVNFWYASQEGACLKYTWSMSPPRGLQRFYLCSKKFWAHCEVVGFFKHFFYSLDWIVKGHCTEYCVSDIKVIWIWKFPDISFSKRFPFLSWRWTVEYKMKWWVFLSPPRHGWCKTASYIF